MQDFLTFLITPLLTTPDSLQISVNGSTVTLKVGDADTGRVIGKHGATINSLRTLVKTYCAAQSLPPVNLILDAPKKA
ncbi:MAG: KH domain-containing protein [Patescibacteria group bacterium]